MPVKLFHSAQVGAPTLTGQIGSLVALLTACLVDGYPTITVTSVTRDGGVVTVVTESAHGFNTGDYARIAGASEAAYNIETLVTRVNATTFTFAVTGSPATPATGTVTVRRTSAGWERAFTGENKAVYRAKSGLRHYLRVVDDASSAGGAREAQLQGFRTMSSVDAGEERFPSTAQKAALYAYKSSGSDASSRPWVLIADERFFYLGIQEADSPTNKLWYGGGFPYWYTFGELVGTTREVDQYATVLGGMADSNRLNESVWNGAFFPIRRNSAEGNSASGYTLRGVDELEGAPLQYNLWGHGWDQNCLGVAGCLTYPHRTDNGFYLAPVRMAQQNTIRAAMPGLYESLHGTAGGLVTNWSEFNGSIVGLEGRRLICFHARCYDQIGLLGFDVTGPWR